MSALIDRTDQRYGRLVVLCRVGKDKQRHLRWLCRCDCLNFVVVSGNDLTSGNSQSCGCLHREKLVAHGKKAAQWLTTHGHTSRTTMSPTYTSWRSMIHRCTNPKFVGWRYYGGANPPVNVCDRWFFFENFLTDMGERPEETTLGRYLDTGSYEPGNVAWMTWAEQRAEQCKKRSLLEGRALKAAA